MNRILPKDRYNKPLVSKANITFRVLYPTFTEWENELKPFILNKEPIVESEYNLLSALISNNELVYNTPIKNHAHIAIMYSNLKYKLKKYKEFDVGTDAMLSEVTEIENQLFTVNRSDTDIVDNTFLDNSTKSKSSYKNRMKNLQQIKEYIAMNDPQVKFIFNLAKKITI